MNNLIIEEFGGSADPMWTKSDRKFFRKRPRAKYRIRAITDDERRRLVQERGIAFVETVKFRSVIVAKLSSKARIRVPSEKRATDLTDEEACFALMPNIARVLGDSALKAFFRGTPFEAFIDGWSVTEIDGVPILVPPQCREAVE